ncbi:hypothetical protein BAUCODRAFT_71670 [Baudoinia panamericana UAMH 10762]|uniref:Zn(2)-C6 fungal-type domain-containing protein n=1 Tax=Baudoinia panamericana (strain UAMH 10762) TaxID=717646 RepID=M2LMQ8_BAUPA|nr:uncharacterized protein BAUCODRAFT_71670 [Baudoinia panamericana UAMH 10762]EMC95612.1 hypothetical protein BAUCODRAFT_71670 [Baudoinia panamericana UAMH 10762]
MPQPEQSEVDDFLRKKRKAREHKACYPCRQRKVKCDLERPCRTCRDRDHPELCSYHPPNKRQAMDQNQAAIKIEDGASSGSVTLGRAEFEMLCSKLNGLESSLAELKREINRNAHDRVAEDPRPDSTASTGASNLNGEASSQQPTHTDVHGIHTRNDAGEIVHLGGGSIPAMLYSLGQGQGQSPDEKIKLQELLGKSVLPLFGLDNESATYPFVDLWGLPHGSLQRAQELARALPNDAQCLNLFRCYRDIGHVIYPGIADLQALDSDLTTFLINRAAMINSLDGVTEQAIFGKTYHWLAVLFAALGSGAQCSAMPRKERELTSQVYICCSFECLRFTNFLSQPHVESIQALLVIGNVMTNNMNAGTAWCLLGLTIRLAQGLGLHRDCPPNVPTEVVLPRSKIWWSIIWQDSLLSLTYDRASTTAATAFNTMPMPQNVGRVGDYHAAMYRLMKIGLDIVRDRATVASAVDQFERISEHQNAISTLMREAAPYLRDSRLCKSNIDMIEHWGFYLHTSYALSELYRPALSPSKAESELLQTFSRPCIDNLTNVVESYLGLNNITSFARQSWSATHRALSSALLLGILREHTRNDRARMLLARFMAVMIEITNSISAQEISAPLQRALSALSKLKIDEVQGQDEGYGPHVEGATSRSVGDRGSKADHQATIITPAHSDGSSSLEDHSPHSVLNSILWGDPDFRYPETWAV